MISLPSAITGRTATTDLLVWRLDAARHAATWSSGEGAFQVGGRWSSKGRRVIYASLNPATSILEVAVHKGFKALDTVAHQLLSIRIMAPRQVHVIDANTITNKHWLRPGTVSKNQQTFGDHLLSMHPFVAVPSVVSPHSWNLMINVATATGMFSLADQEDFALDPRLS